MRYNLRKCKGIDRYLELQSSVISLQESTHLLSIVMPAFQAIVIGAGIAGLSTALGLQLKGVKVIVLEKYPALRSLGGPVQLRPNASRVLIEYGLREVMDQEQDFKDETDVAYMRRWENAATICELRASDDNEIYGFPYVLSPF